MRAKVRRKQRQRSSTVLNGESSQYDEKLQFSITSLFVERMDITISVTFQAVREARSEVQCNAVNALDLH